ncbi:MAG TPA: twin-arginine translocation signal domain-containing protein, partial [Candidatus Dormibacteraeota bacterium]|nr:twin-arginine translocation signal domain-containing protein [Candidatus Dormibacteraeota bacterium]
MLTRRDFLHRSALATAALALPACTKTVDVQSVVKDYPVGALEPVPVIRQRPEWTRFIILVSWCGKPADLDAVRARPGWAEI